MTLTLDPPLRGRLGRGLTALLLLAACTSDDASTTDASASASGTDSTGTATASTSETGSGTASSTSTAGTTDATDSGTATASGSTTAGTTTAGTAGTTTAGTTTDSSGTDTGAPVGECESDDGCVLWNSCCSCAAVPVDTPDEQCPGECFVTSCEGMGLYLPSAACRLGRCALAPQRCNPAEVACDALPPECPDGFVASVVDVCWGSCVPAHLCDVLPACSHGLCGPGWMCVESQAGAFKPHCEPIPAACDGAPGCGCAAGEFAEVCQGGCEEGSGSLICADGG
ncbi:MAG: hypothetical protein R3B09_02590 [Nannocystaceae bacterium]